MKKTVHFLVSESTLKLFVGRPEAIGPFIFPVFADGLDGFKTWIEVAAPIEIDFEPDIPMAIDRLVATAALERIARLEALRKEIALLEETK